MNEPLKNISNRRSSPVTNISTVPTDPNTPGQSSNRVWHWPGITRSIGRWFTQLRPTTTWDWRKDGRCTISIRGRSSLRIQNCGSGFRRSRSPSCVRRWKTTAPRRTTNPARFTDASLPKPTVVSTHRPSSAARYNTGWRTIRELDREDQYRRCVDHLTHKYAEGGYLRLWIPESDNALRLARLRELIRNRQELRRLFDEIFDREMAANG